MTKHEWLNCTDPNPMLNSLRGKGSERKLRLFACACCRRDASILQEQQNRRVLEANEDFADGQISRDVMEHLWREWYAFDYLSPTRSSWPMALAHATMTVSVRHADIVRQAIETALHASQATKWSETERRTQAAFLQDLFGNLFHSVVIDSSWLAWNNHTIPKLAQAIYDDRAFDRLPILADALEEAGCTNADILNHCRQSGEHVRGCWVVDLLLGKS